MKRVRGERGDSGPLEVVILIPAVLFMFALVVGFGRVTNADTKVEHAAAVGARAAAGAQTAGGGQARAEAVARQSLVDSGVTCGTTADVSVGGDYRPGGRVTVTVSCEASLGDLTQFGAIPGSRTLTATATEVIDVTRGGAP